MTVRGRRSAASLPKNLSREIGENFVGVANWQRVVTSTIDQMEFAIRETRRDLFREAEGKGAIFSPMPKPNRHTHFFQGKPPGSRIDLGVSHHASGGRAPGLPGTFKARLKRFRVAQNIRITGL